MRLGSYRCRLRCLCHLPALLAFVAMTMPVRAEAPFPQRPEAARHVLRAAKSWGYQLQNLDVRTLTRSTFDVLVLDAGSPAPGTHPTRADVHRLKLKPDGRRRLLLAYLNIGEAEDYRYYWQKAWATSPPAFLGTANCRWKGDHRVRHWHREWQAIIFGSKTSYLGRLIDQGYDGVWLDRVDIFYAWLGERWQAATDMVSFVALLSQWAKALKPDFLVVPQNGEELISDPAFLRAIDGYGKEDLLFGDRGNGVANHPARVERALRNFEPALALGLPILAVEYLRLPEQLRSAEARLRARGFLPYFGPRSLSRLGTEGPEHPEDRNSEALRGESERRC